MVIVFFPSIFLSEKKWRSHQMSLLLLLSVVVVVDVVVVVVLGTDLRLSTKESPDDDSIRPKFRILDFVQFRPTNAETEALKMSMST